MKIWRWLTGGLLIFSISGNIVLLYILFEIKKSPAEKSVIPLPTTSDMQADAGDNTKTTVRPEQALSQTASMKVSISQLLKQGDYDRARFQLQNALKNHPRDADLLLLEAELLMRTAPLSDVALHYYDMLDMGLSDTIHETVSQRLQRLVDDAIDNLSQTQSWTALAIFAEPLFQYAPGNRQYTLALATAYAEQEKPGLMAATLAALPPDDPAHGEFASKYNRQPQPEPERSGPDASPFDASAPRVALLSQGSHFIVPIRVEEMPLSLLLDTGASQSALSADAFNRIKHEIAYRFLGNFTISTASGNSQAALIEVKAISISIFRLENLKMFVLPKAAKPRADGLLGMNILGQFTFFIDQRTNTLHLQKDH
ncbi:clan AA aspartic protease [Salinimonas sp. HHU 13199]|uniref:Clan AA aspartic protease n=1 Tax=Salinimonas profundi TaxID=2729140 RepID=A0ABR8LIK4_9ALTE|nr:retropepsin-like aspartic protease [Salinimonas profundi]MBD3584142.1 clan AA aspartic protease [Salinimonas profundi]